MSAEAEAAAARVRPLRRRVRERGASLAVFALVAAAVVYMLWPMQRATYAINDDHSILGWLRQAPDPVWGRPGLLARAIANDEGRWRPGYHALWTLEAAWAGKQWWLWHLDRIVLALLCAVALFLAVRAVLPPGWAALSTLLLYCGFHNEAFMRLEVQEAYATPLVLAGIAVIAAGWPGGRRRPAQVLPGLVLVAFAGTVKESFVPVLPSVLLVVGLIGRWGSPRGWTRGDWLATSAPIALTVFQAACVLHSWRTHGPYYGMEITLGRVAATAARHTWWITKDSGWVLPVAAATVVILRDEGQRRRGLFSARLLAAGATLLVPQWIILATGPLEARFLLPGHLFGVFAAVLGLWVLRGAPRSRPLLLACGVGLAWFAGKWVIRDHDAAEERAAATHAFQAAIDTAATLEASAPGGPFVFRTGDPWDYEPIHATWTFLRERLGRSPRAFLVTSDERPSRQAGITPRLMDGLRRSSEDGDGRFLPLSSLRRSEPCIELTFRASPEGAWCDRRVQFPPPE